MSRAFAVLMLLHLADAVTAQTAKVTVTPTMYPAGIVQLHGDERWLTARIVDGITGEPIAGAEFLLVAESNHPMRGEFWWQMRTVADADGFVRIRNDEQAPGYVRCSWVVVRAEGYGAVACFGYPEEVILLARAETMPVQVLDWQGRPVADALVGFCAGCGHTPDLAFARSDAAGLAQLTGVDPHNKIADLYVEHPDLDLCYASGVQWSAGEPPLMLHVRPGVPAVGAVVDADGKAISGAYVGCRLAHRGPWTRTAADGTFHLYGASEPADLHVHVRDRELVFDRPRTQPFRLQVPAANGEAAQAVHLPEDLRDPCQPQPMAKTDARVSIRAVGLPEGGSIELRTAHAFEDITQDVARGVPIALPAEPFAFALEHGEQQRVFAMTKVEALAATPVELRWFAPTRITGQVVDERGQPLAARLDLVRGPGVDFDQLDESRESAGTIDLLAEGVGRRLLVVRPTDSHHLARVVPIMLPARGDEVQVDVGSVPCGGAPRLQLRSADRAPLQHADVSLLRRGLPCGQQGSGRAMFPLDTDGVWLGPDPQRGDAILVHAGPAATEQGVPFAIDLDVRFVLTTDGPYTLRLPNGELLVTVHDPDGKDLDSAVTIGEQLVWIGPPKLLRRVPPGKQRLFVAAENHQSAIVDVDVPASGRVPIDVVLPPR